MECENVESSEVIVKLL